MFTPASESREVTEIAFTDRLGVPDLALPHDVITDRFLGLPAVVTVTHLATSTQYARETVWRVARTPEG